MVVASTFWFGRETLGVRLEDNRPETVMSIRASRASQASGAVSRASNLEEGGGCDGIPPPSIPPSGAAPPFYPKVSPAASPDKKSPVKVSPVAPRASPKVSPTTSEKTPIVKNEER